MGAHPSPFLSPITPPLEAHVSTWVPSLGWGLVLGHCSKAVDRGALQARFDSRPPQQRGTWQGRLVPGVMECLLVLLRDTGEPCAVAPHV